MRHRLWAWVAALTVGLGLLVVVAGIFMATVWAPERRVNSLVVVDGAPAVVTAPGFLAMNGARVTVVSRSAPGVQLFLGVARSVDVESYLGDAPRRTVVGLTPKNTPIVSPGGGADRLPQPRDLDIWVERVSGDGVAKLTWTDRPGSWVVVAASDGRAAAADHVVYTWDLPRKRSAAPAVIALGVLLVVTGVIGLALFLAPARVELPPADPPVPPAPGGVQESWMERSR